MLIWKLALRNLLRNGRRTFLTVMLIACSVAALIFTDGFMIGMTQNMVKSATRLFPGDGQIHHPQYLASMDAQYGFELSDTLKLLRENKSIDTATARALSPAMISSSANVLPAQVVGIMPKAESQVSKITESIVSGNYLDDTNQKRNILIGHKLADKLEVSLGDRIVLSLPSLMDGDVQQDLFRVSGIFKFNSQSMDKALVFLPLPVVQTLLGKEDFVHEVAFNFYDPKMASDESLNLWAQFNDEDKQAQSWRQLIPELASMLAMTDYSLVIIGIILFIIAALGVINAMFMSIYERIWELGVLKAVGTSNGSVFTMIMAEGFLIALISVAIGCILGFGLNQWVALVGIDYSNMEFSGVSLVEPVRTIIRAEQFIQIPGYSIALTLLASCYPAWFASRIMPARALHKTM